MSEVTKYQIGESVEIRRSSIKEASYNPRRIEDEAKKSLKKGIKNIGLAGGIVINETTGNTIVSGHQRIAVLDDLEKYDKNTQANDYIVRVDLIHVDEKTEKELVVLLNNPNAQGEWDYDKLKQLVPEIDYKMAGLTDADLSMIGVDFLFKTEQESSIESDLDDMMAGYNAKHQAEVEARKAAREEMQQAIKEAEEQSWEDKVNHMKEVKAQVKEKAEQDARNKDAYVVLSFDTSDDLQEFLSFFGLPEDSKFIKGETIMNRLDFTE